ncbi:hypothetical protein GCM10017673_58540 [Streptosporangium violaceochromogenes]|nr:hypothetical protein GCM10017673_58540 [Streptosporangium violaceochromogenes]
MLPFCSHLDAPMIIIKARSRGFRRSAESVGFEPTRTVTGPSGFQEGCVPGDDMPCHQGESILFDFYHTRSSRIYPMARTISTMRAIPVDGRIQC